MEAGGLEHDGLGVVLDLGVRAAHDARDRDRLVVIADGEHLVGQVVVLSVQRLDGLAGPRAAHDDLAVRQAGVVERVHRLAVLEHDVVGDVNDVVDRAHAGGVQALAHPDGRGFDLDVAHQTRSVARAQVGVAYLDRHILVNIVAHALDRRGADMERAVKGGGGLARQTDDAQAVRAVGGDLEIRDPLVQTHDLADVVARLAVLV